MDPADLQNWKDKDLIDFMLDDELRSSISVDEFVYLAQEVAYRYLDVKPCEYKEWLDGGPFEEESVGGP